MKQLFLLIAMIPFWNCKAQSPILPLLSGDSGNIVQGAYYKDLDNVFDKFVGSWKYTNGSTSLIITFKKKTIFYNIYDDYYEDILVGEYKYIENGIEIVNTLPNLTINYSNQFNIIYLD
jgi:hypothetical protein